MHKAHYKRLKAYSEAMAAEKRQKEQQQKGQFKQSGSKQAGREKTELRVKTVHNKPSRKVGKTNPEQ